VNADDKVLVDFLGKELFDELENTIKASAEDERNFLLDLKKRFVKDIKSIDLI